jgi:hypothetical protein
MTQITPNLETCNNATDGIEFGALASPKQNLQQWPTVYVDNENSLPPGHSCGVKAGQNSNRIHSVQLSEFPWTIFFSASCFMRHNYFNFPSNYI